VASILSGSKSLLATSVLNMIYPMILRRSNGHMAVRKHNQQLDPPSNTRTGLDARVGVAPGVGASTFWWSRYRCCGWHRLSSNGNAGRVPPFCCFRLNAGWWSVLSRGLTLRGPRPRRQYQHSLSAIIRRRTRSGWIRQGFHASAEGRLRTENQARFPF